MQEICKDPAIKLFGQKIPFPEESEDPAIDVEEEENDVFDESETEEEKEQGDNKDPEGEKVTEKKKEADSPQNPKTPSIEEEEAKTSKNGKSENIDKSDETNNTNNSTQDKTLKKPDKLLPCPRCNSMDTKFCYYNNYNINQPRYFCKACQRYWTAGGTMRNVPVGAGRRKNKNSSSHYRHITISEALQAARIDNGSLHNHHHLNNSLKTNGRVLSFGLDQPPICDSMASILNLQEKTTKKVVNGTTTRNGFHHVIEDQRESIGDDSSSASSITMEESGKRRSAQSHESLVQNTNNGFISQVPCIPPNVVPWPYPWNSQFPISFYPAPFWNWNVPWFSPHQSSPKSPNSPTLGKHSRDDANDEDNIKQDCLQKEEQLRQRNGSSVLVPKTLRIDDPNEAAKSSIWATLGIKNECVSGGGGMFKAFQSKKEDEKKNHRVVEASSVLRANPAALSRSLNFHENS